MKKIVCALLCASLLVVSGTAFAKPGKGKQPARGLNAQAALELEDAGVFKYVGQFEPVVSAPLPADTSWTKHTFDPSNGDGPICIAGTPFSVFTKAGNPAKVMIMLQGGGACWQGLYSCNILAEAQEPPAPAPIGIWDDVSGLNPVDDWSVVYMPYCDGSVFSGDNAVLDPAWQAHVENIGGLPPGTGPLIRFHHGLRNVTAGIDIAKSTFPNASRILVTGSSAGGVGAAGIAPFLARKAYGNNKKLMVFNDAGPVAVNLAATDDIAARAADWGFGQFYPESCDGCDDMGQGGIALIKWRLENDSTIREAFYSTDYDETNRFFMGLLFDPIGYRNLVVSEHGAINAEFPDRYKSFIQAGKVSHTALQTVDFYTTADGVPLFKWLSDFLVPRPFWTNIVEDFVPPEFPGF